MDLVDTGRALKLFYHYLREVVKYQQILELNTNNIITSLVTQFRDLQAFISNPIPTLTDVLYLSLLLRLFFTH